MAPELDATSILLAGAANHRGMFAASAAASGGSVTRRFGGVLAVTPGGDVQVGFPQVPPSLQAEFASEVVALARTQDRIQQVGWWTMDEAGAAYLGSRLLARGFRWGWRPTWMVLDTAHLTDDHPAPPGLTITEIGPDADQRIGALPDLPPEGTADQPSSSYWAAALGGRDVGDITLHCSDVDGVPVGGIYATNVVEDARRQGIGTALTIVACQRARETGCRYVVLNATPLGLPVYRRVGFRLLGESGQTWWMTRETLRAPTPSDAMIEFVEAIGDGDLELVERTLRSGLVDLREPLSCGLPPYEVAALTGQSDLGRRLTPNARP